MTSHAEVEPVEVAVEVQGAVEEEAGEVAEGLEEEALVREEKGAEVDSAAAREAEEGALGAEEAPEVVEELEVLARSRPLMSTTKQTSRVWESRREGVPALWMICVLSERFFFLLAENGLLLEAKVLQWTRCFVF